MKKVLLGLVLVLVFSSFAQASNICTPITISQQPTTHDDGNGPTWNLGIGGSNLSFAYYSPGAVINTYGLQYFYQQGLLPGYANVYAGFNGCNQDWTLWVYGEYAVYDNTLHEQVAGGDKFYIQLPKDCGVVISCVYNGQESPSGDFWVTKGHQYQAEFYIWAVTSVGTSVTYERSVTINVN